METGAVGSGFKNGINVFLRGRLWDPESSGRVYIFRTGKPESFLF
ncbi:hypothetical protein LEP1GSC192_0983 [Leptospira sp. B5-022]|nr:hypothetical protein LEP1GSC192_0983 [Leptospira sp. B5-022]